MMMSESNTTTNQDSSISPVSSLTTLPYDDFKPEDFNYYFGEEDEADRIRSSKTTTTTLLTLPRSLRLEIYKRVHFKHFKTLRLICTQIKSDIDHHLGISAWIDERDRRFEDYFETLGIRQATIMNLISQSNLASLRHPKLLNILIIRGIISSNYFSYFVLSCENLSHLSLEFDKPLFHSKPKLFPQYLNQHCLPNLKSVRCSATTKKDRDLIYVCENVIGLLKFTLNWSNKLLSLNFEFNHKTTSPYLEELVLEIIVLVHKHANSLQEINFIAKDSLHQRILDEDNDSKGGNRKGTGFVDNSSSKKKKNKSRMMSTSSIDSSSQLSYSQATLFRSDKRNSEILEQAESYLNRITWPNFPFLKKINFSMNSGSFGLIQDMLTNCRNLNAIKLEMNGGVVINCWLHFSQIIQDVGATLTIVKLVNVSYEDFLRNPLDIDFSVFSNCTSLKILSMSCPKRETHRIPRGRNVTSLPKTLQNIEMFWITFSTWQLFRLLFSYKHLKKLKIAYASPTERSFGWFLWLLKILITWNWTNVETVVVTDLKIRFRNKRAAVKWLKKVVPVNIEYLDREETLLNVERKLGRKSNVSIPSIES